VTQEEPQGLPAAPAKNGPTWLAVLLGIPVLYIFVTILAKISKGNHFHRSLVTPALHLMPIDETLQGQLHRESFVQQMRAVGCLISERAGRGYDIPAPGIGAFEKWQAVGIYLIAAWHCVTNIINTRPPGTTSESKELVFEGLTWLQRMTS
jgi:hypothetical protein